MTIFDALSSARQYLFSATAGQENYHAAYFAPQKEITIEVSRVACARMGVGVESGK